MMENRVLRFVCRAAIAATVVSAGFVALADESALERDFRSPPHASGFTGTHDVSGGAGYYDESTGEDHRGGEGRYRLLPPKGGMKLILR